MKLPHPTSPGITAFKFKIPTTLHSGKDTAMCTRKKFYRFSLLLLLIGLAVLAIAYYFFHFVTDEGLTLTFHEEAGKPFVTILIGIFGVLFVFSSALSALFAAIVLPKDTAKN